ncbi:uncharacterized protein IL334_003968 [Kwoniella shivajii]|uniref:Uncharacterized protein n=1 Tax=Kwoniella shivajii TaxID=564305 RepID=A0ABZ1D341_9TREE|nr:hypothetical protein IL334_003968 [Kwoniella shivajii]
MPVTKKKGTLFAIYADSPDRSQSQPQSQSSSSSTHSKQVGNIPKSPTQRSSTGTNSRKALSLLQPKAVSSVSSDRSSDFKSKKFDLYDDQSEDVPLKTKSVTSEENSSALKTKSRLITTTIANSTKSQTTTLNQPINPKFKSKSSITVFSDENSRSSSTLIPTRRTASAPLAVQPRLQPQLQPQPQSQSQSQSIKRSRDLLSPLPILSAPATKATATTSKVRSQVQAEVREDPSESPAKRTRAALSTPSRAKTGSSRTEPEVRISDKENIPVPYSPGGEIDSINDSPATRTRSKLRALNLSTQTSSPLRSNMRSEAVSRVERLVGDGRGTLTLKKGRELAMLLGDEDTEREIKALKGSPESKKTRGKGITVEVPMLSDVSEAYGAEGYEPEGFKTQRHSIRKSPEHYPETEITKIFNDIIPLSNAQSRTDIKPLQNS